MIELLLLTLLFSVPPQSPEGWKGIVPLVTTRSEAEKIVGVRTDCENYCTYKTGEDQIFVQYAGEPCSKENKWLVPKGTVIEFSFYGDIPKLSELKLYSRKFKKTSAPELNGYYSYGNELSIRATVGKNRTWQRATYRGLTMGKSKMADMLRIFGKPTRVERFDEDKSNPEVWYHYDGVWEFPGTLRFIVDQSRIIRRVDLLPTQLTKEDAIKHFGPDYIETRYDFDSCLGNEEAAPLFESPTGAVINIEYRQRGVAFALNAYGNIDTISFVSGPVGAESSKCK